MTAGKTHTSPAPVDPVMPTRKRYRPGSLEFFGAILLAAILFRGPLESLLGQPALQSWATVFIAICVQATPFLVLGVVVSGAIAAFVPAAWFTRVLPDRPALAVPVAAACGRTSPSAQAAARRPASITPATVRTPRDRAPPTAPPPGESQAQPARR